MLGYGGPRGTRGNIPILLFAVCDAGGQGVLHAVRRRVHVQPVQFQIARSAALLSILTWLEFARIEFLVEICLSFVSNSKESFIKLI